MTLICYHASHEQFAPSHLLKLVVAAEQAGFAGIHSSDHFHPWSAKQGQSGFTFSWIGAALQATALPYSMVCAPGQRYHPAIVAQAVATLDEMFPGRINVELGSGEALNEAITGEPWPDKATRNERLVQSAGIIRRLLQGEKVSFNGHVQVKDAMLYTLPRQQPLLLCAALTRETAEWAGTWADGLLTATEIELQETRAKIKAFRDSAGSNKPVYLQFSFTYARDEKTAVDQAWEQWRVHMVATDKLADFSTVEQFEAAAANTTREEVAQAIPVFTDMEVLKQKVFALQELEVDRIILHNVNLEQETFIEDYGKVC
jgi:coenzyme F420-dependent glucose-6-phosphate dehydrogenase